MSSMTNYISFTKIALKDFCILRYK